MSKLGKLVKKGAVAVGALIGLQGCAGEWHWSTEPKNPSSPAINNAPGILSPGNPGAINPVLAPNGPSNFALGAMVCRGTLLPLPPRPDEVPWGNNEVNGTTYAWKITTIEADAENRLATAWQSRESARASCSSRNPKGGPGLNACLEAADVPYCSGWREVNRSKADQEMHAYAYFQAKFNQSAGIPAYGNTPMTPAQAQNQTSRTNQQNCLVANTTASRPGGWKAVAKGDMATYINYANFCRNNGVNLPVPPP